MILIDRIARLHRDADEPPVDDAALVFDGGTVAWSGPRRDLPAWSFDEVFDADGAHAVPGLVDPHADLLALDGFDGREAVLAACRAATRQQLIEAARPKLASRLRAGVTTSDLKTGWGLSVSDELKQLDAIAELSRTQPLELSSTFRGAHFIPPEYREAPQDYVAITGRRMMSHVAHSQLGSACEVCVGPDGFTLDEAISVMESASRFALPLRAVGDRTERSGIARAAAELGAIAVAGIECATDADFAFLRAAGTVPIVLPGESAARRFAELLAAGLTPAVASDAGPGSPDRTLGEVLADLHARGIPASQLLRAVTTGAAAALGAANRLGSLQAGRQADVVLPATSWPRWLADGAPSAGVRAVFKHGRRAV